MTTQVNIPEQFQKKLKTLSRKYPAAIAAVRELTVQLENNNRLGDQVPNVGYEVYKVRLKNPSAGKGKSGGFRVIYYARLADYIILITIYAKTEQSDITPDGIRELIEEILVDKDDTDEK